jgi:putative sterol carrier protein
MPYKFLTNAWFNEVKKIRASMGEIQVAPQLKDVILNVTITGGSEGDKDITIKGLDFVEGHSAEAKTTIVIPIAMAKKMFIDNDKTAAMQAFMSGQLKVKGDMSKMMALAGAKPTPDQDKFREKLVEITEI